MIHDPAGGADDDLHTLLQLAQLDVVILAAEDRQDIEIFQMPAVVGKRFRHLDSQFPGRGKDENLRALVLRRLQHGQKRQGKGSSFTGTGLRLADDISARQHMGDHLFLDRRRGFIPGLVHGLKKGCGKVKIGKRKRR